VNISQLKLRSEKFDDDDDDNDDDDNDDDDNNTNNNNNNLNYKDLIIEIQRMWRVKGKVIPEIKRATGTISKSLGPYLSDIPRKHEIKELQKNSRIGHCTHTTESANVKVQSIFHERNSITCSANCKYRIAATLYTLETWK
jgi:hypothetical protein